MMSHCMTLMNKRPSSAPIKTKNHSKDIQALKKMLTNVSANPEEVPDDCEEDDVEDDVEDANQDAVEDCEDDGEEDDGEDLDDLEEDDEEGEDLFSVLEYFFVEQKKNRNIVDVLLEMKRSLDTHNKLLLEILKKK